jgi:hypothetical protein
VLDSFSVLTGAAAAAAAAADVEGADVGDLLVPEGIRSAKFQTHLDEPGVRPIAHENGSRTDFFLFFCALGSLR